MPVTEHDVTACEYVDALHSVHSAAPSRRIRAQAGAATIRQGMLRHAATTDIPKALLAETARLFEQRLADVNKYKHRNCAVLHGDAWTLNMVRDRYGQIRWVDLDQAGWARPNMISELACSRHDIIRHKTSPKTTCLDGTVCGSTAHW